MSTTGGRSASAAPQSHLQKAAEQAEVKAIVESTRAAIVAPTA